MAHNKKDLKDKSVMEQIFDKFDDFVKEDDSFKGISDELSKAIRNDKRKKCEMENILKKVVEKKNEDN